MGDLTIDVKISKYNQQETVLDAYVFSDTPLGTKTAYELNCLCGMVDRTGALSLLTSKDHYQIFSPSQNSDIL